MGGGGWRTSGLGAHGVNWSSQMEAVASKTPYSGPLLRLAWKSLTGQVHIQKSNDTTLQREPVPQLLQNK